MFGLPKHCVWEAREYFNYSNDDLSELRKFIVDTYYNAFVRHRIQDEMLTGDYRQRKVIVNGKMRDWRSLVWNDFHMEERDGLQVIEIRPDDEYDLIITMSNWELERLWKEACH